MTTDFLNFSEELLNTTNEAIKFSHQYLEARKQCSHCFNQLQILIQKAGLHISKKSAENKIIELLAHPDFGAKAQMLNREMSEKEAEYKGLELVVKSYQAHASAIQSVIKTQISGEIAEATKNKYSGTNNT